MTKNLLFTALSLLACTLTSVNEAQAGINIMPTESGFYLHPGFAYSDYRGNARFMLSLGISKTNIDNSGGQGGGGGALSIFNTATSWSVSALGLFTEGKIYPGLKLSADAQFMVFDARIETGFTTRNVFITPLVGFKVNCFELLGGYNIVLFEGGGSGLQVAVNLSLFQVGKQR